MDLRGIAAGDGDAGEQMVQQPRAGLGKLVQHERSAGKLGEDGEQPGAGRGLQHEVGRRDRGGGTGREAERDRRRELLEHLALFGAARMGGRSPAILASIGSKAAGDAARARMAVPNLRRNRTVAASQES